MSNLNQPNDPLRFAEFSLDRRTGELFQNGERLKIQGQPIQILEALLDRPGELVTQEELARTLWPEDTHVDYEQGLRSGVQRIRAVLGDSSDMPRFIETVPRRGYRYIGPPPTSDSQHELSAAGKGLEIWERVGPIRGAAALLVAVLAVAAFLTNWRAEPTEAGPPPEPMMLAVLPIASLDADDGQDPFSRGLTTEIINQLADLQPGRLEVLAESVSSRYRDATEIRYAVKVDYLIEGTIRREGNRARVSVRLVPAFGRTQKWGETYEVDVTTPFASQEEIATQTGQAIWLALDLAPQESN